MKTKILSLFFALFILSSVFCGCARDEMKELESDAKDMKDTAEENFERTMPHGPSDPIRRDTEKDTDNNYHGKGPYSSAIDGILGSDFPGMAGTHIGTLFDESFTNGRWYHTDSDKPSDTTDGENDYVTFEGDTVKNGISSHVKVVFSLDSSGKLDIHDCTIDDVKSSKSDLTDLLTKENGMSLTK
ncbi:MAG: hypothetical protein E7623_01895 [Ruminococcaceae bacterium]|nr:hypothetical protein [Oscillospiraceae bacterium]